MSLESGTLIKYEVWDTAGQERYESLAPMYYRGAHAAVVVYDITSMESFDKAQKWIRDLNRQANPNIVVCLVGNKLDMASSRAVPIETATRYASDNDVLFIEASAKTGEQVSKIFELVASKLPVGVAPPETEKSVDVAATPAEKKGGCCAK